MPDIVSVDVVYSEDGVTGIYESYEAIPQNLKDCQYWGITTMKAIVVDGKYYLLDRRTENGFVNT